MGSESAVEASYAHCRRIARRAGSNFYAAFRLLPRPKRQAMWALYAFLRRTDDLGDADTGDTATAGRRDALKAWRGCFDRALTGHFQDPLLPALKDTVDRYGIPHEYLSAVLDGVEMDLGPCRYATFDELKHYCYRVASAVGLACIHVWGFSDPAAIPAAEDCGIAFQLTNILRDLKEDMLRDRVYLPQEDLDRFGYSVEDLRAGVCDARLARLVAYEIERAEQFYGRAMPLANYLGADGKRIFTALVTTYHSLLDEIRRAGPHVLHSRVRLGRLRRMWIVAHTLFSDRVSLAHGSDE